MRGFNDGVEQISRDGDGIDGSSANGITGFRCARNRKRKPLRLLAES